MREFCSTEGCLLVRVWSIFGDSEYQPPAGELEFMEEVQRACHDAVFILHKWINWDEMTTVFDYEFADESGPDSLARVIYDVVTSESEDLDEQVLSWLQKTDLPIIETPGK